MQQNNSKKNALIISVKKILAQENLDFQRQFISELAVELKLDSIDCAAALLKLNQPDLFIDAPVVKKNSDAKVIDNQTTFLPKLKLVRYRLDVGRKHSVSLEQIKQVLIEVSGVDVNRIGKLEVRNYYTLVDLPDGMPADIFQLLSETEINQQSFKIKRIKNQTRFYRRKNKKYIDKRNLA